MDLILSFHKPLNFHSITIASTAVLDESKYLRSGLNINLFCDSSSIKYFASLRLIYPFIKPFVNSFVDINLTSLDRSFVCFVYKVYS